MKIDSYSFGAIVINGKTHRDDLTILPEGEIRKPWWRKQGHRLIMDDLQDLIQTEPEVVVVGTGVSGGVRPDEHLKTELKKLTIDFIAAPNEEAISIFNELVLEKRVGAGFHLTC